MNKLEQEDIKLVGELPYNWDMFTNKTFMISGATGFIGSFLVEVLKYRNETYQQNIKIVSLTRRGGSTSGDIEYIKQDISKVITYERQVDYILHLASNTHPKAYDDDPIGTIINNVYGCNNLLKYAVENNVKRFLLASSVEIYGEGNDVPMKETDGGYIDCNNARNGYNEAKRTCEALCQSYKNKYGIDVVIARLSRIFGADKTKNDTKALSQFMNKAVNGEDIVLKSKGAQRYSYCYVADAVSGIFKILLDGTNGEAYNIAADDDGRTLGDYAKLIASFANKDVIFDIQNDSSVSKATMALLDTSKIKGISYMPLFTVEDGLKRTYNILKDD